MSRQLILDLLPPTPPTLDNFVVGANAQALEALRHCRPGRAIYLWGGPGSGKTHLLKAAGNLPIGQYIAAQDAGVSLQHLANCEQLPVQLIAVDDVDRLDANAQAALFGLYNRWREAAATTRAFILILAGDRAPLTMPLREDLRTRLGWDLIYRLDQLSDDDRAQALHTQADERGLHLAPEVVNWILSHYTRNMSHLSALLNALDRYSIERHRAITIPLLKDLLATSTSADDTKPYDQS